MHPTVDQEKCISSASVPITDETLVIFTVPYDPENPKDWAALRKWAVTGVLSATGFNRIMVSTMMAPALPVIARELQMSNTESVMALSVYLLATALGPLLIGPLSEVYGRKPVLHATNVWFLLWNIVCGFANTKELLIAARFLAGFGASAIYALAGGVLGDVWPPEQRGRSLGLYILIPLLGAAAGPILGGFITRGTTWRWMFWSTSILQVAMVILSITLFHETYAPTILKRRAQHLRHTTGSPQYCTEDEKFGAGHTVSWLLLRSLTRPLRLLLFHPIIQIQALLSALSYGLLYIVLSTYSTLWTTQYHQSPSTSSLHYLAICLGEILGSLLSAPLLDLTYRKPTSCPTNSRGIRARNRGPESRLPLLLPATLLLPTGLLLYGCTAQSHAAWPLVDLGALLLALGLQLGGQALQAYVLDAYPTHTGSAAAAAQFPRSVAAFALPLGAPRLYQALGYGLGNGVLAAGVGGVWMVGSGVLWVYGGWLRARAKGTY